jgi:hypothetical protein
MINDNKLNRNYPSVGPAPKVASRQFALQGVRINPWSGIRNDITIHPAHFSFSDPPPIPYGGRRRDYGLVVRSAGLQRSYWFSGSEGAGGVRLRRSQRARDLT